MKKKTKNSYVCGIIALVVVMGFSIVNCDNGSGNGGGGNSNLSGEIIIYPSGAVTTGTELIAIYSGDETVSYQWKKGGIGVGTNSTYTPTEAGNYTVTVSANGYNSKTSAPVIVSGASLPALTGTVIITGNAQVGETLMANTTALSGDSGTISYQWKRGTNVAGANSTTNIGTNSNTYTVQAADAGSTITVTVTYSGSSDSVTSAGIQIPAVPASIDITVRNAAEWNAALDTIKNDGSGTTASPKAYTITVNGNVMVTGSTGNSFGSAYYIAVTINGNGKLYLLGQGSLLTIGTNQTVYIDGAGLTLQGLKIGQNDSSLSNNTAVVSISGGTLELRNGTISDNSSGSGVNVSSGSFTMSGGTISGNTSPRGGGVCISGGSFTMSGGAISGNTSIDGNGSGYGGGVYTGGGSFIMSGGTISNNSCGSTPTISDSSTTGLGGGVCVYQGSFTMTGGTISGNSARGGRNSYRYDSIGYGGIWTGYASDYYLVGGGGVYIYGTDGYNGSFTKSGGGSISGNDIPPSRNFIGYDQGFNTTSNGKEVFWDNPPARYRDSPLGTTDNISTNTQTGWGQ
jgi:hypothetical protein